MKTVVLFLSPSAFATARAVRDILGEAELHALRGCAEVCDHVFCDVRAHVAALFKRGQPIVGVCASGILIRVLSGVLGSKKSDPPVLSVAADGSCVVPLLGAHHGANELARRIAGPLGAIAALTTGGDVFCSDFLPSPHEGSNLADPRGIGLASAYADADRKMCPTRETVGLLRSAFPLNEKDSTEPLSSLYRTESGRAHCVHRPYCLAVGIGCERGTSSEELIDLLCGVLEEQALSPRSIALVASIEKKADEKAIHDLAAFLGCPVRFLPAERLCGERKRLHSPSFAVERAVGTPSVAEAAALVSVGEEGKLFVAKRKSDRATCALAVAPEPIDPTLVGRARGRLTIVGIGPGDPDWITPEVGRALREAQDWIGYGPYLERIRPLLGIRKEHVFSLGEEEKRARHALALAAAGRKVVLVSSGDPGLYAMATLVCELMDGGALSDSERRIELIISPGISAFQAVAARVGAPIGHDSCLLSLSDLLTPWPLIERRLLSAARGDFVTILYNPRSQRRKDHLARALSILSQERSAKTPVILASRVGLPRECIRVTTIAECDPNNADMETLVIVGASSTKIIVREGRSPVVYTPRGYAVKAGEIP